MGAFVGRKSCKSSSQDAPHMPQHYMKHMQQHYTKHMRR